MVNPELTRQCQKLWLLPQTDEMLLLGNNFKCICDAYYAYMYFNTTQGVDIICCLSAEVFYFLCYYVH